MVRGNCSDNGLKKGKRKSLSTDVKGQADRKFISLNFKTKGTQQVDTEAKQKVALEELWVVLSLMLNA